MTSTMLPMRRGSNLTQFLKSRAKKYRISNSGVLCESERGRAAGGVLEGDSDDGESSKDEASDDCKAEPEDEGEDVDREEGGDENRGRDDDEDGYVEEDGTGGGEDGAGRFGEGFPDLSDL